MTFGEIIKRERVSKGLSMERLASEAGIGKSTVYNIEHSNHLPQFSTRKLICDALEIDLRRVMDEVLRGA